MNDHDPEAVAACMTPDYRSEAPLHPTRNVTGREQVRRNWRAAFESTPDLEAEVVAVAGDDETVWTEWEIRGSRTDGSDLDLRGVAIWGMEGDLLRWGRIYLDQVATGPCQTWEQFYNREPPTE